MKLLALILPIFLLPLTMTVLTTKEEQMNCTRVRQAYADKEKISLWSDLRQGYDLFNLTKKQPEVRFQTDGSHEVF